MSSTQWNRRSTKARQFNPSDAPKIEQQNEQCYRSYQGSIDSAKTLLLSQANSANANSTVRGKDYLMKFLDKDNRPQSFHCQEWGTLLQSTCKSRYSESRETHASKTCFSRGRLMVSLEIIIRTLGLKLRCSIQTSYEMIPTSLG